MNLYENAQGKNTNQNTFGTGNDKTNEDLEVVETIETAINTDTENGKLKAETTFSTTLVQSGSISSMKAAESSTEITTSNVTASNNNLLSVPHTPSVLSLTSSAEGSSNDGDHNEIGDLDPNVPVIIGETMTGKMPMDIAAEQVILKITSLIVEMYLENVNIKYVIFFILP